MATNETDLIKGALLDLSARALEVFDVYEAKGTMDAPYQSNAEAIKVLGLVMSARRVQQMVGDHARARVVRALRTHLQEGDE